MIKKQKPNRKFQVGKAAGSQCGHYYPDFLRNYDEFSKSGKIIERHCYCFGCRREYIVKLNPEKLANVKHIEFGNKQTIAQLGKQRKEEWKLLSNHECL